MSENVHEVPKICHRKYMCVLRCLSEFYVFVLHEIDVR